eukprot:TRINITY_DN2135_c0_g1_i1.p1 TRINITY_DN2135_c0_g1~~TRINITY_DN2135_c0_g1_i1.p1  ORF type:complete len:68 (-),score=11.97 TRINITY_DN2135_c0_g1_i1:36-239(-)
MRQNERANGKHILRQVPWLCDESTFVESCVKQNGRKICHYTQAFSSPFILQVKYENYTRKFLELGSL